MTDIPRTLKTFGGIPLQIAKRGDVVRPIDQPNLPMIVDQAYPDGSVRGSMYVEAIKMPRMQVLDAGAFELVPDMVEQS